MKTWHFWVIYLMIGRGASSTWSSTPAAAKLAENEAATSFLLLTLCWPVLVGVEVYNGARS